MKRSHAIVVAVVLGAVLLAAFPRSLGGQAGPAPHELVHLEKSFANYSKDYRALEAPLRGSELEEVEFLDGVATTAEDRLHAANVMLAMYSNVTCKPDREKVKPLLKEQLDYYSWQMGNEADRSAGSLQFAKMPAVAKMGFK